MTEEISKPFSDDLEMYEVNPSIDVYSWCDAPAGSKKKASQVHVHISMTLGEKPARAVIRFKSAKALDSVIEALIGHRVHVWGPPR